jgi:hypothetical protein
MCEKIELGGGAGLGVDGGEFEPDSPEDVALKLSGSDNLRVAATSCQKPNTWFS